MEDIVEKQPDTCGVKFGKVMGVLAGLWVTAKASYQPFVKAEGPGGKIQQAAINHYMLLLSIQAGVIMVLMYWAFCLKEYVEDAEEAGDKEGRQEAQERLTSWMDKTWFVNYTFTFVEFGVFTYEFVLYCNTIGDVDKSKDGAEVLIFISILFWELYVCHCMLTFYKLFNPCVLRAKFKKKLDGESKIAKKISELKKKRRNMKKKYNDFKEDVEDFKEDVEDFKEDAEDFKDKYDGDSNDAEKNKEKDTKTLK